MLNTFDKILTVIEHVNAKFNNPTLSIKQFNEIKEFISRIKRHEKYSNKLVRMDLTDYPVVKTHLHYLYYETLDFFETIESLYEFSEKLVKQCKIQHNANITHTFLEPYAKNTNIIYKNQIIYRVEKDIEGTDVKKGNYFYIDSFNKNNIAIFDRQGKIKFITNLTGKVLINKTNSARKECYAINLNVTL